MSRDEDIIAGIKAIKQQGIWFCGKQIECGLLFFNNILQHNVELPFNDQRMEEIIEIESANDEDNGRAAEEVNEEDSDSSESSSHEEELFGQ